MGRESLWGWFGFGVVCALGAAGVIVLSTSRPVLLAGVALGVLAGTVVQVTTIGLGVQIGMARHEHLKNRR